MQKSDPNAPPLRHHKSTDRAYAVDPATRKFIYFGAWGSRAASEAYKRWLIALDGPARSAGRSRKRSHDVTVHELIEEFVAHITPRHQKAVITSTRCATNVLDELYGSTPAVDFEPLDLLTVQRAMIDRGWCWSHINCQITRVKRVFKFGGRYQLIPATVHAVLDVESLEPGDAADGRDVTAVDPRVFEATLPHLPRQVRAICELLRYSGARTGEICQLKMTHLDRSDPECWDFRPPKHKGRRRKSKKQRVRVVPLGPRCIEILKPYLRLDPDTPLFSPAESERERYALRRAQRMAASHARMREALSLPERKDRKRPPGEAYTTAVVRKAIERGCRKAKVPRWTPHQLRHLFAKEGVETVGVEATRAALGHERESMTMHYAGDAAEAELRRQAARQLG